MSDSPSSKTAPDYQDLLPPMLAAGEEAWTEAHPFPESGARASFVSGRKDSQAIRIRYFARKSTAEFIGRAWFGPDSEGPPGHAHGGSQAAVLDEGMGAAAWFLGHPVLAAKIEINFRNSVPLGTEVTLRVTIDRIEGRKVFVSGRLNGDDEKLYAESTGLFIEIPLEELSRRLGPKR